SFFPKFQRHAIERVPLSDRPETEVRSLAKLPNPPSRRIDFHRIKSDARAGLRERREKPSTDRRERSGKFENLAKIGIGRDPLSDLRAIPPRDRRIFPKFSERGFDPIHH